MIKAAFFRRKDGTFTGFEVYDHAGYADPGEDIVCAAASMLVTNTVNSIESFTEDKFTLDQDQRNARISLKVDGKPSEKCDLLLSSLALGMNTLEDTEPYSKYIDVIYKEA
ncbi:MAG: ribosomal-processing cysteine protease Prp [Eubacterium sp.]|nr:ribosomal-processing cysteine protease Prp [Eubacterium sp.]